MTASMYILLLLAFIFANAPFLTRRSFGIVPLAQKHFGHNIPELAVGFILSGLLARLLEARAGSIHPQDWEFYTVVFCLYLVFAFPAFVWRYFWYSKHTQ